jgi:fimbrial chaperone protein
MKRFLTLSAIVLGLALQAGNVSASAFRVTPIRLSLERNSASSLLTLTNESKDTLRFQITAFAWSQEPNGTMKLEPTKDILFFPALLTLDAGAERKVRVSAKAAPGTVEKTYRIFFEELPSLAAPGASEGAQVKILTKMGVPIFLAPNKVDEKASIDQARLEKGTLRFHVKNEGNVRFAVQGVSVRGVGAGDATLFERQADGWYVLAGTHRAYELAVPADVCGSLQSIVISARTDSGAETAAAATTRIDVSQSNCK